MISQEKTQQLEERLQRLKIREEDLTEKFVRGSGSGGQKINKTSSCVYLKHVPSGTEVKCQQSRSREVNRFIARHELCDRIETAARLEAERLTQIREKKKRQNRGRSRAVKRRMLEGKRRRGVTKSLRRRPARDD